MISKPKLILIGAGGHARACIDVLEQQGSFEIAGLIGTPEQRDSKCLGYSVIGVDADLPKITNIYKYALIAVGQIESAKVRENLYSLIKKLGFELPTIVSPIAYVSPHARIGSGTIVMPGSIVNAGATIGNNCIINSCSLIEHDSVVENTCHISTGAIINGSTTVGSGSFIGSGAIVREGLTIGRDCFVGMGALVVNSLKDQTRLIKNAQL